MLLEEFIESKLKEISQNSYVDMNHSSENHCLDEEIDDSDDPTVFCGERNHQIEVKHETGTVEIYRFVSTTNVHRSGVIRMFSSEIFETRFDYSLK